MNHQTILSQASLRAFTFFITLFLVVSGVSASSVKQLEMNDMLTEAELVFEGIVTASEPRFNASKTLIITDITFDITEVVTGEYQQSSIELSFVGGVIGEHSVHAEGLRQPQVGESGIYFVSSLTKSLVNPLVGWSQGHFLLEKDESGVDMVMTDEHLNVLEIQPITLSTTTTRSSLSISQGVAKDVVVSKEGATGMSASAFKQELKRRMTVLNK